LRGTKVEVGDHSCVAGADGVGVRYTLADEVGSFGKELDARGDAAHALGHGDRRAEPRERSMTMSPGRVNR